MAALSRKEEEEEVMTLCHEHRVFMVAVCRQCLTLKLKLKLKLR